MTPPSDDELELRIGDIVAVASRVLEVVSKEEHRELAFAGAALAAIMLHSGPSAIEADIELVEELSEWLAARPPSGSIH